jgi:hypothetical protein
MKKAIEALERAKAELVILRHKGGWITPCKFIRAAIKYINEDMAILQSPRWETPEQWEKRTGEKWKDDGAVYWRMRDGEKEKWPFWFPMPLEMAELALAKTIGEHQIVIATEAGPPPDNWSPEVTE